MDFYRINEEYNRFLREYEKEKRGVTKVPNIKYTDRNKFAFGAVMQVNGMNYYVSVSSFDKKQEANFLIKSINFVWTTHNAFKRKQRKYMRWLSTIANRF